MFHVSPIKRNVASETEEALLNAQKPGLRGKQQICKCEVCLLSAGRRGGGCAKKLILLSIVHLFSQDFVLGNAGGTHAAERPEVFH